MRWRAAATCALSWRSFSRMLSDTSCPNCSTLLSPVSPGTVCVLPSAAVPADDWPAYRGPTADGHAVSAAPLRWSESENVRWKTAVHGKGWSSPVIWGRQIWMTTAPEDGKELLAVCLDRDTGKIIHDVK